METRQWTKKCYALTQYFKIIDVTIIYVLISAKINDGSSLRKLLSRISLARLAQHTD